MFKESRAQDHTEVKNDIETHVRSRRLPLIRKMYAFYHAPIVKFWSNTVRTIRITRPQLFVTHIVFKADVVPLTLSVGLMFIHTHRPEPGSQGPRTLVHSGVLSLLWIQQLFVVLFKTRGADIITGTARV